MTKKIKNLAETRNKSDLQLEAKFYTQNLKNVSLKALSGGKKDLTMNK